MGLHKDYLSSKAKKKRDSWGKNGDSALREECLDIVTLYIIFCKDVTMNSLRKNETTTNLPLSPHPPPPKNKNQDYPTEIESCTEYVLLSVLKITHGVEKNRYLSTK